MASGYSGTPLAQKLTLKSGMKAWFKAMPASVRDEIDPERLNLEQLDAPCSGIDAAHLFHTERAALAHDLAALRQLIQPAGFIWVSWPKKAAKVETDITEDVIREVALPMGLVDVKVCAVDDIWSGLKLVIRKHER